MPDLNRDQSAFASDVSSINGCNGLTKREYFAGLAMQGWIASYAGIPDAPDFEGTAEKSVGLADALLAELEK